MARNRCNRGKIDRCEPICVECGRRGQLVSGAKACPRRPERARDLFWLCECGAYVGCHAGTALPLGRPAGTETRGLRARTHDALDVFWRRSGVAASKVAHGGQRERAYRWLARELGLPQNECHIGRFDAETCRRAIAACQERRAAA